jgi:dimethylargininase
MSLVAITREVSASLNNCELSFHAREPIDVAKAVSQHQSYQDCLADLGLRVVNLPPEPTLPDAVFVEDPAVVLDEVAIILNMGAKSRRPEAHTLVDELARYRLLTFLFEPGTADGGDIFRAGRRIFAGVSNRTNLEGCHQLRKLLEPYGYELETVTVKHCLHLKSACSYLGRDTLLINESLLDLDTLRGFQLLSVPKEEPAAANVLAIDDTVIMPVSFPKTQSLLERHGFKVRAIDVSELQKAEGGVTCCSLIFEV